jgi:hypothetical protein
MPSSVAVPVRAYEPVEGANAQLQSLVAERVAAANPDRDSPAYPLKRMIQLEKENLELRKANPSRRSSWRCHILGQLGVLIEEASERGDPSTSVDGRRSSFGNNDPRSGRGAINDKQVFRAARSYKLSWV